MFSRDIKCDKCGFCGKIEAKNTVDEYSSSIIFSLKGKTRNGYLVFGCPNCTHDVVKSPYSFFFSKGIKLLAGFVLFLLFVGYLKKWDFWDIILFPISVGLVYLLFYCGALFYLKVFSVGENSSETTAIPKPLFSDLQKGHAKFISFVLTGIFFVMALFML